MTDLTNYVRVNGIYIPLVDLLGALTHHVGEAKPGQLAEYDAKRLEWMARHIRDLEAKRVAGKAQ